MSGYSSKYVIYQTLHETKKQTITNLCVLISQSKDLVVDDKSRQELMTIVRKYNAANYSEHGKIDLKTYESRHPGYLDSYFKTPELNEIYLSSAYYKNLPKEELTKDKYSIVPLMMMCSTSLLWVVSIIVTGTAFPEAYYPVLYAAISFFAVVCLLTALTDTACCLHDSPIFNPSELEKKCGDMASSPAKKGVFAVVAQRVRLIDDEVESNLFSISRLSCIPSGSVSD